MDQRFQPCPRTPNCVSSYATDPVHAIEPLPYLESMDAIVAIVESFPRTRIIERDGGYLHATFTSRLFRFVDDVEFLIDPEARVIQVRSASRLGAGDLGVNRERVESIRRAMEEGGGQP